MNHRPFEDWLLDDQPLNPQQARELQAHVRSCTSCAAIAESNMALHATRRVGPAAGFTDRFRLRLVKRRREQRWRQVIGTLVLVIGGLGLVYWLTGPVLLEALRSPASWITAGIGYFFFLLASAQVLSEATAILLRVLPSFISPTGWMVLTLGTAGLAFVWTVSIRRVARAPQGV
ncbi:MAG: anti-sigma factor family protein [Anaerolineae bacterium]